MPSLKEFRKSRKLTQERMAKKIDVSLSFYTKVESGYRRPSRTFLNNFKSAFPDFDMNIFFAEELHGA